MSLFMSESENKLENLLNYLKYLSNIKFSEKENLVTLNSAKWFNDLFSNLGAYNIKEKSRRVIRII
ncbi:hypothetical protein N7280_00575 [Rickettsia rhipicephali]|nr:hypothetical protein [Rickettsia rhipicephali]